MAQQHITIGTANAGNGDTPFAAWTKAEANFNELYATALANFVTSEVPSGTKNGINLIFTFANGVAGFFHFYVNGQLMEEGIGKDYTRSGPTVTMTFAPESTDKLSGSYIKS